MSFLTPKKHDKVITINFNWLLFAGSLLMIFALALLSNAVRRGQPLNLLSCQLCLTGAFVLLLINHLRFWSARRWIFLAHFSSDLLYAAMAVMLIQHDRVYFDVVLIWAIVVYVLLAYFRINSYCHARRARQQLIQAPHPPSLGLSNPQRHDHVMQKVWQFLLFSGCVNIVLALCLLCLPIDINALLTVAGIDIFLAGVGCFCLGLAL